MKEVDLTVLEQTDSKYGNAALLLSEKYKGAWNDEVHNSFRPLLNQIDENHSRIHSASTEAKQIYDAVKALNINGLCQTAERLCREVDSL